MPPEASKKRGYVGVVQSLVAFSRGRGSDHGDEPKKKVERQRVSTWFSSGVKSRRPPPPPSHGQQLIPRDGRPQDKAAKYKDKFDPRVTARYVSIVRSREQY